jgi:plastocyanin
MKPLVLLSIFAVCEAATAAISQSSQAEIKGRVVVSKTLTKKRVTMPSYQLRGVAVDALNAESSHNAAPIVDELSRVVIYLEAPGLDRGTPITATLTQRNRRFDPEFVVIPVGSTVSFPNADPIFHNVFSLSKVKAFDLGYYPDGQTQIVRFDRPGVVQVYCHLHADMTAAILVVPTALWTRPRPDGSFSLSRIPPGSYELVVWHRSAGFFRRRVTVNDDETVVVDLEIPLHESYPVLASAERGR